MINYSFNDGFYQVIRLSILFTLCYQNTLFWNSTFISILAGGLEYLLIYKLFQITVYHLFDYESMGTFDYVFFLDDLKNNSNILGAIYFDQF
jgi:hypothetical protein